jgi:hypothetical protein
MRGAVRSTNEPLVELVRVERQTARRLRADLLDLGRYLDWDARTVIRFTEAITGRPWRDCGAAQVVRVGQALLDISVALREARQSDITTRARAGLKCGSARTATPDLDSACIGTRGGDCQVTEVIHDDRENEHVPPD